jgi:hypothetical protein
MIITVKPEKPIRINTIYVKDRTVDSVWVRVNGALCPVEKIGKGYERELKIRFEGTVSAQGLTITVQDSIGGTRVAVVPHTYNRLREPIAAVYGINGRIMVRGTKFSTARAGSVCIIRYVNGSCKRALSLHGIAPGE